MTISYKWLSEYLPVVVDPERLGRILTSIGLEVESFSQYEEIRGSLKGLVIGEVVSTEKHPNADKLTLTRVNTGNGGLLQIVCGAPNVASGQKVVVAPVGSTIYPASGDPLTMKVAKIRNVESYGMICAEDEIGMGNSHEGIMVLPSNLTPGTAAVDYFQPYTDYIYEIGLTPNRMDAMSHWGVARDVCAYLSHHDKKTVRPKLPASNGFKADSTHLKINVKLENEKACPRFSGVSIDGIRIAASPAWLQQKLRAIGVRPINNIVDITNFIQHETGQPLHAYDLDAVTNKTIVVKNLPDGTVFKTLDDKDRKLSREDLMICNDSEGMCIAGVFGGLHSGVTEKTKAIFLEAAYFDPVTIRKTSFRHGLRTDAASRFEKGIDISSTVTVLKRAAQMIREICGGQIASEIVDLYPDPEEKKQVTIKYHFLKKISGKIYHPDAVKEILESLGFEVVKEGIDELRLLVPFHKRDISMPADIAEEVLRIDGLDNIEIPGAITLTPSIEENLSHEMIREKISDYLVGLGFNEILTNSITNSAYFNSQELETTVKMMNNLSAELDILRPSMLETGLEAIAHNLNHKNNDLQFFEFGKVYSTSGKSQYHERWHLSLYATGNMEAPSWRKKASNYDFYRLKGIVTRIFDILALKPDSIEPVEAGKLQEGLQCKINGEVVVRAGVVAKGTLKRFDIKQEVFFADFDWELMMKYADSVNAVIREIPKYPAVQRDISMVVPRQLSYQEVERTVDKIRLTKLRDMRLFDIFESEKLGSGKKSLAVSFTFIDEEKTLTDKEIDGWMNKIMNSFEKELEAEIRKN